MLLSLLAFTAQPDQTIENSPLFHDSSLYKKFYMIISVCNVVFNIGNGYMFISYYTHDKDIDKEEQKEIFGTYCFFFVYFQIIGMIFNINSINYYRIAYRKNYCYLILMFAIIMIISLIYLICEYSFHPFLYGTLSFEYNSKNVDTFDDKNKLISFTIYLSSIISFYLCVLFFFTIFNKLAQRKHKKQ